MSDRRVWKNSRLSRKNSLHWLFTGKVFMPHHIANGAREILAGKADVFVPYQEVNV